MTPSDSKPLMPGRHIILGDSAAGTFLSAFHAREPLLIDQDVLCCGPTLKCDDLRAWDKLRHEYWSSLIPGEDSTHVRAPFNLLDNADSLRNAEQINVWAATSLSEQLFIANVVRLADFAGAEVGRIAVVQFETLRDRSGRIMGMGELNEEQMRDHPEPVSLSKDALDDYRAAWRALTSEDPTGFERFASERPSANTWLKNAMQLMLRRFPDVRTGLTHWDSVLLKFARSHGPRVARIIGFTMARTWDDGDLTGDSYLFGRLLRLGDERLPKPLVALTGDRTSMRNLDVALTAFGEEVLEGRASNYPANPIEDWAAGVKLSSKEGKLWFNDGGRIVNGST